MRNRLLFCLIFLFLFSVSVEVCFSISKDSMKIIKADSTIERVVKLKDGSMYTGFITEVKDETIILKLNYGELEIEFDAIDEISGFKEKSKWYKDYNRTRLFFSPTGRALEKGNGYFIDYYLFFPGFTYGITDNITIGGGMSLFPGISFDEQLYYFTPQIGLIQSKQYSFAVSAFIFQFPDETARFGFLFGTNSFQKDDVQFTAGLGYGYLDGELSDKPAVIAGINWRYSEEVAFISENWIIPGEDPLISYGVRFLGEKIAVDLGLFNLIDEDPSFPGVLYGNFTFHF